MSGNVNIKLISFSVSLCKTNFDVVGPYVIKI